MIEKKIAIITKNCFYTIKYNYNKMADNIYKNSDHYKEKWIN